MRKIDKPKKSFRSYNFCVNLYMRHVKMVAYMLHAISEQVVIPRGLVAQSVFHMINYGFSG